MQLHHNCLNLRLARATTTGLAMAGLLAISAQAQSKVFTLQGLGAGDHFGWAVGSTGDVNGDQHRDFIVGIPYDDTAGTNAGKAVVFSGKDGRVLLEAVGANPEDRFGFAVAGAGDINKDGFNDVIVGAPGPQLLTLTTGSAQVISGRDGSTLFTFTGSAVGDSFGNSVSGAGDVDNDTWPDVIIGAPGDDEDPQINGSIQVRSGRDGTLIGPILQGKSLRERFGETVSGVGDINGDGFGDFIVGAPLAEVQDPQMPAVILEDGGAARVYSGIDFAELHEFGGIEAHSQFGFSAEAAGDVDNDGKNDYLIGARFEQDRGRFHVISGNSFTRIRTITGPTRSMWFGNSVSGAGDMDNDGWADIIVGAPIDGVTPGTPQEQPITGGVKVYPGRNTFGRPPLVELTGQLDMGWMGWSVAGLDDITGDGVPDFVVGTPLFDGGKGRVEVFSGNLGLTTDVSAISTNNGGSQNFSITAGAQRANAAYILLPALSIIGTTGVFPGTTIGPVTIPINIDGYTTATLSNPGFPWTGLIGLLDGAGNGFARLDWPPVVLAQIGLFGLTIHSAVVTIEAGTGRVAWTTNPVSTALVPNKDYLR